MALPATSALFIENTYVTKFSVRTVRVLYINLQCLDHTLKGSSSKSVTAITDYQVLLAIGALTRGNVS